MQTICCFRQLLVAVWCVGAAYANKCILVRTCVHRILVKPCVHRILVRPCVHRINVGPCVRCILVRPCVCRMPSGILPGDTTLDTFVYELSHSMKGCGCTELSCYYALQVM